MRQRHRAGRSSATALAALAFVTACAAGDATDTSPPEASEVGDAQDDASEGEVADGDTADDGGERLRIPSDDLELEGVLRLPDGPGPHPTVVIVHGSGPHSRDGELPGQLGLTLPQPVAVYRELARGLEQRGYGALTYDKRTCGSFNGCADNAYPAPPNGLTIDAFVADAAAAIAHLHGDERVGEVVVLGHSQGGTIVLEVAATQPEVAATILLATPRAPIDEMLAQQVETTRELVEAVGQDGTPGAERQIEQLQELAAQVAALRDAGPPAPDAPDGSIGGASPTFWRSWIELSDRAPGLVDANPGPILVLGGDQDWNVRTEDVRAWEDDLRDRDELQVLEGITHALTRLDETDLASITPGDIGTEVDPAVLDTLAGWLDDVMNG